MLNIVLWNLMGNRIDRGEQFYLKLLEDLIATTSMNCFIAIESPPSLKTISHTLYEDLGLFRAETSDRFTLLLTEGMRAPSKLTPPVPSERSDFIKFSIGSDNEILLCITHGLDRRNNPNSDKRQLFFRQLRANVEWLEGILGHRRTLVCGDFNANPFESEIKSALGLNASLSKSVSRRSSRKILGTVSTFFYNPMWRLHNDHPPGSIPGTYFYAGQDPDEVFWHLLDQFVVRPEIADWIDNDKLQILSSIGGRHLLTAKGRPHDKVFSDHLPIMLSLCPT